MITNTTVAEASGYQSLVSPSSTPSARPVTTEPAIDPMPPITTMANTVTIIGWPMIGETCIIGAASTPANAASAAPRTKNGTTGTMSVRVSSPFFHQRISNSAAGNEQVTVLLSSASENSASAPP